MRDFSKFKGAWSKWPNGKYAYGELSTSQSVTCHTIIVYTYTVHFTSHYTSASIRPNYK